MNILYSTLIETDNQSSPGQHVLNVVSNWEKQGHSVRLMHPLAAIGQTYKESWDNPRSGLLWRGFRKDWAFSSATNRELQSGKYDLVYHRFSLSSVFPVLKTKLAGVPLVLEMNADLDADLERHWGGSPLVSLVIRLMADLQFLLADQIIAVSEGVGEKLRKSPLIKKNRVAVVPNGADLELFYPRDKSQARRELSLEDDLKVVVYSGSFQKYQGVETIIRAAIQLREEDYPLQIYLLGDGPEKECLQELVSSSGLASQIRFIGWCPPEKVAVYLAASDICLAPYTRAVLLDTLERETLGALMKGSPLKVFTYLAAGRPVIASHFAEAGLLIEEHQSGLAVRPEDPGELAQAIRALLDNPGKLERMGKNARRAAEENFGWDKTAERIARICQQVIQSRS